MIDGSVARRYAKALFELATEADATDRVLAEIDRFAAACRVNDGQLGAALCSPLVTSQERTNLLAHLLPALAIDGVCKNFLFLLSDKGRMEVVQDVVRSYRELADAAANRVRATVTTAAPIDPVLRGEVTVALSRATGKTVVVETKVDPSILGGLVAQVGSVVYDASLLSRLERLHLSLTSPIQA